MSKVRKPKPESMKNYFYLFKQSKYELFEPPVDNDHEIVDRVKKFYNENTEEKFIDELIFCNLENLCMIKEI
jgi:hypothetical protein